MKKKSKVLITDYDGFNVHNPDQSHDFIEFETLYQAKAFAKAVEVFGWKKAKTIQNLISIVYKKPRGRPPRL